MSADWFAGRLRELRTTAGLTQKELAERIGITIDGLAKLERGDRKPGWETVVALCGALGVSADAFLQAPKGEHKPQPGRPKKDGVTVARDKQTSGKKARNKGKDKRRAK